MRKLFLHLILILSNLLASCSIFGDGAKVSLSNQNPSGIFDKSNNKHNFGENPMAIGDNILKICIKINDEASFENQAILASKLWGNIHDFNEQVSTELSSIVCEHALIKIMPHFSNKQIAHLLHNVDHVILSNVDFLQAIPSFACLNVENEKSRRVLSIIAGVKFFSDLMVKTMPVECLFYLFEERGFELELSEVTRSSDFFTLLSNPPFNTDHRTFRLVTCEHPFTVPFFSTTSALLGELTSKRPIGKDLIESVLAHYIRSEAIIIGAVLQITPIWMDLFGNDSIEYAHMLQDEIESIKKWKWSQIWIQMAPLLQELHNAIRDRTHLMTFLNIRKDDIPIFEKIMKLLKCSCSLKVKNSPVLQTVLSDALCLSSPYDPCLNVPSFDLYALVKEISADYSLSPKFEKSKWMANFITLIDAPTDPAELILFKDSAREILRYQKSILTLQCKVFEYSQFDYFMLPLLEIFNSDSSTLPCFDLVLKVRNIICLVKFDVPGVVEAILESPEVTSVISKYARAFSYDQICDLLENLAGRVFLKHNPDIIKRFQTLRPFLREDFLEFGINLNDPELNDILFSADPCTINDQIKENNYNFFNNPTLITKIPRECIRNDPNIWQLCSFSAFSVNLYDHCLFDLLRISKHFSININNQNQFISLVCRWIIHIESLLLNICTFQIHSRILEIKNLERLHISQILQIFKNSKFSLYSPYEIDHLIHFLTQNSSTISDKIIISDASFSNNLATIKNIKTLISNENEFICNLIERDEAMDSVTKSIWIDRAKSLISP